MPDVVVVSEQPESTPAAADTQSNSDQQDIAQDVAAGVAAGMDAAMQAAEDRAEDAAQEEELEQTERSLDQLWQIVADQANEIATLRSQLTPPTSDLSEESGAHSEIGVAEDEGEQPPPASDTPAVTTEQGTEQQPRGERACNLIF